MREHPIDANERAEAVAEALRKMVSTLPQGAVSLTVEREPGHLNISLRPANENAAAISVRVEDSGWAYLALGRATPLEVHPAGGSYCRDSFVDEIVDLCSAVVNGRFEETVWIRDSDVVRSKAVLWVVNKPIRISYGRGWAPLWKRTHKSSRDYEAWAKEPD